MNNVALISDYGSNSIDLMSFKLSIINIDSKIQLFDISHDIPQFDCAYAMFALENYLLLSKQNSIVILAVNSEDAYLQKEALICKFNDSIIITYNHGFLTFLNHLSDIQYYSYRNGRGEKLLLNTLSELLKNDLNMISVFEPISVEGKIKVVPNYNSDSIKMTIVANDRFGNAYTNVYKKEFEDWIVGYKFEISISRGVLINEISNSFSDVNIADLVAFFSNTGMLVIGINYGDSQKLLRLNPGESFRIKRNNTSLF